MLIYTKVQLAEVKRKPISTSLHKRLLQAPNLLECVLLRRWTAAKSSEDILRCLILEQHRCIPSLPAVRIY